MLQPGHVYDLTIARISPHGLYLADAEGEEVLLPNRFVSLDDKPGERKEAFVYHDSENRLVATTARPLALVGQVAQLEVVGTTEHGAFLEWGADVPKDVFVPKRNMIHPMAVGRSYVVMLYNDNITGRVTASPKLKGFISNEAMELKAGDGVEIVVVQRLEAGFRVVVNDAHWGMIYHNQIFRPVEIGERARGRVVRVTDDKRLDVSLQAVGLPEVEKQAARLEAMLRASEDGFLPINDDTPPEAIAAGAQMSKKVFKRALGYLLKKGVVETTPEGMKLKGRDRFVGE